MYHLRRFPENPIIHADLDSEIGTNINGPSLIRVPDWVTAPLGRYYLYFAHHQGTFIRMAYADDLCGPWTVHGGGVLKLGDTACRHHIASPDVHVSADRHEIVMYFHGPRADRTNPGPGGQVSYRAVSPNGLLFHAERAILGPFYFRVFRHADAWFAIAKTPDAPGGGVLLRSEDGIAPFERGPDLLPNQRHVALLKRGDTLQIFYSRGEDCPERILVSEMPLNGDWQNWRPSEPVELLRPETEAEGGLLPARPSGFGAVHEAVNQVRDPAIFEEEGRLYLLYSGAGERNICAAELKVINKEPPTR